MKALSASRLTSGIDSPVISCGGISLYIYNSADAVKEDKEYAVAPEVDPNCATAPA